MKRELLYLKNLTVEDETGERLEDVSLLLREGECICMASTVRQKETLVRYLRGKGKRLSGEVEICGSRLDQSGRRAFERRKVFVVGRNEPYMTNLTIGENVFLLRRNSLKKVLLNEKAMESQTDYYFRKFGIPLSATGNSVPLSSGERSLVAMVRCISQGAKVLVLWDISGLFSAAEMELVTAIIRRLKEEGVGILISDNNPEYFYPVSDEMVIFKHRRIAKKIYDPGDFSLGEQIILRGMESAPDKREDNRVREDETGLPWVKVLGQTTAGWSYELEAEKGEILLVSLPAVRMEQLWESLFCRGPKLPVYAMEGKSISAQNVDGLVRKGIVFGYAGTEGSGVIRTLSAADNILLPSLRRISGKLGFYRREAEYIFRDNFLLEGGEKLENMDRDDLKLMMYRFRLYHPKVMILHNIFTTADIKERDWLRRMVISAAGRGTAVILLENERGLCTAFADRVEKGERWT